MVVFLAIVDPGTGPGERGEESFAKFEAAGEERSGVALGKGPAPGSGAPGPSLAGGTTGSGDWGKGTLASFEAGHGPRCV